MENIENQQEFASSNNEWSQEQHTNDAMENHLSPSFLYVSEDLIVYWRQAINWASVLLVVVLLVTVFQFIILAQSAFNSFSPYNSMIFSNNFGGGIIATIIGLIAQWCNYQFIQKMKSALQLGNQIELASALRNQRDFFMWTLIGIGSAVLMMVLGGFGAIF